MSARQTKGRRRFRRFRRFRRSEDGTATIEFVILFPLIWMAFGMAMEAGMYTVQNTMLERGLDLTVREVRLGIVKEPNHALLVTRICANARLLPNCADSLRMEMIRANPRAWTAPSGTVRCIDRAEAKPPAITITNGGNNELMVLRACILIKPLMPFAELGRALVDDNPAGEYALTATSSYVMEPFAPKITR
ncbi:TadE-like protein [Loktanella fryxellensis]|uniref:TadE-like protein n=1 Tax=Loktanella fryxellensis TaxID=245187 RepID=A0A1H8HM53_9RHOB|nr:TadE family protein [Loktanella fryxellensis]SEN57184.1 TadE-like protein [Loktanella fryxellensis]